MKPSVLTGETGRTRGWSPSIVASCGKRSAAITPSASCADFRGVDRFRIGFGHARQDFVCRFSLLPIDDKNHPRGGRGVLRMFTWWLHWRMPLLLVVSSLILLASLWSSPSARWLPLAADDAGGGPGIGQSGLVSGPIHRSLRRGSAAGERKFGAGCPDSAVRQRQRGSGEAGHWNSGRSKPTRYVSASRQQGQPGARFGVVLRRVRAAIADEKGLSAASDAGVRLGGPVDRRSNESEDGGVAAHSDHSGSRGGVGSGAAAYAQRCPAATCPARWAGGAFCRV